QLSTLFSPPHFSALHTFQPSTLFSPPHFSAKLLCVDLELVEQHMKCRSAHAEMLGGLADASARLDKGVDHGLSSARPRASRSDGCSSATVSTGMPRSATSINWLRAMITAR